MLPGVTNNNNMNFNNGDEIVYDVNTTTTTNSMVYVDELYL